MKKHFDRLGLREEASWDEIQKAFNQNMERLRCRQYEDDQKGRKKDKERRLLIRSYYALQEFEMNGRVVKKGMAKPENKKAAILLLILLAKVYWNMDTIDDVHAYLCDTYSDYETVYNLEYIALIEDYDGYDENVDLCLKIDLICAFYGFYTKYQAHGKKDPYTEKGIGQYHTYLQFLNQHASAFAVEISRTLSLYRV